MTRLHQSPDHLSEINQSLSMCLSIIIVWPMAPCGCHQFNGEFRRAVLLSSSRKGPKHAIAGNCHPPSVRRISSHLCCCCRRHNHCHSRRKLLYCERFTRSQVIHFLPPN
ncbi:hypothetical protein L596_006410 [Steinernema carpocapsae]|uniref:Uncharacterized protein n=1 Tax=Steinernema carpocapsae TaxID=34508 RepID=A0A4V6I8Z6_STECR|nr:hypothetical protein L596_006410 [Steinernema carpocapsae]